MYQVLARKWRPQSFDDLVGQDHVARTLANAVASGRLAHAYLFAGLRGSGKTSVARILAKCLNCEKGPAAKPCGQCVPCREIAESRALDVLEIDAASRTGVNETRELLEILTYPPVRDRSKVVIIDEVHMLSKNSFNALLKTIEEPPRGVVFILATTELQKILPTILSRCQVFEFRRVPVAQVAALLRRICDAEGVTIGGVALERIARAGEGSVRDAVTILERVIAFCGTTVDDRDALRLLGGVRAEVLNGIVAGLARRDAGAMLAVFDGVVDEGHDLVHFWSECIGAMRDLLLLRAVPDRTDLLARSPEEAAALAAAADGLSQEDLSRAFRILADLEPGLRASSQPRFLFEAALIRLASLGAVRPIEEFLSSLAGSAPEPLRAQPRDGSPRSPAGPALPTPSPVQKKKAADADDLVNLVHDADPLLAAALGEALVTRDAGGSLRVELPPGLAALKKEIEKPERLALLRRVAGAEGERIEITVEVAPAPPADAPARAPAEGGARAMPAAPPASTPTMPHAGRGPAGSAKVRELIRSEPVVGALFETFGAQVVDVRTIDGDSGPPAHAAGVDSTEEEG